MRLKADPSLWQAFGYRRFQFQTGAIKSIRKPPFIEIDIVLFQFQTGAIKRGTGPRRLLQKNCSFNSKLVRLKVGSKSTFPNGRLCFNSKLVRLKVLWRGTGPRHIFQFQFQTGAIKSRDTRSLAG